MPPEPVLVSWSSGQGFRVGAPRAPPAARRLGGAGDFHDRDRRLRSRLHPGHAALGARKPRRRGSAFPLYEMPIPWPCPNEEYEAAMRGFLARVRALPEGLGASRLAFGDLFLEDVRRWREENLRGTGFAPLFPIWGRNTSELAGEMMDAGLRAIVTAVDPAKLPARFAGRWFRRPLRRRVAAWRPTLWARTANSTPAWLMGRCSPRRFAPEPGASWRGRRPARTPMARGRKAGVPQSSTRTSNPWSDPRAASDWRDLGSGGLSIAPGAHLPAFARFAPPGRCVRIPRVKAGENPPAAPGGRKDGE